MRKQYTKVQYDQNGNKQCTKCGVYKTTADFHKYYKSPDGLKPWCKPCVKEYDLVEHDPKRILPRKYDEDGNLHCRNCGKYFKESDMKASKTGKYKGFSYCKTCDPLLSYIHNIRKYNMTIEQYHKMLEDQNYSCKICGQQETTFRKRLSVDHDHSCCPNEKSCGKCIRGLLCHHCNAGLGNFKDNKEIMQKAINYLNYGK